MVSSPIASIAIILGKGVLSLLGISYEGIETICHLLLLLDGVIELLENGFLLLQIGQGQSFVVLISCSILFLGGLQCLSWLSLGGHWSGLWSWPWLLRDIILVERLWCVVSRLDLHILLHMPQLLQLLYVDNDVTVGMHWEWNVSFTGQLSTVTWKAHELGSEHTCMTLYLGLKLSRHIVH